MSAQAAADRTGGEGRAVRILMRADATPAIGTGHVVRCRTLGLALHARGAQVTLACAEPSAIARRLFEEVGLDVVTMAAAAPEPGTDVVDQAADAAAMLTAAAVRPDWILVDHYQLGADWERRVRPETERLAAIDDLFDRPHATDLLLNQSAVDVAAAEAAHRSLASEDCRRLLGPRYALLRPEYRRAAVRPRHRVERVLVFFGGTDPDDMTGVALDALSRPELRHLHVDVVVGAAHPHRAALRRRAETRGRTTLHAGLPHLADLMAAADLAVGAGGSTTWERLCVGLPSVVVTVADNQLAIAEALARTETVVYAGCSTEVSASTLAALLAGLIEDAARLEALSRQGPLLVDGLGTERVVETLLPTAAAALRLRPAQPTDGGAFFAWVNDPVTRAYSLTSAPVDWETHRRWFAAALVDPNRRLFVLETPDLSVGMIRFDRLADGAFRLSYSLDPVVRGRGWGRVLVRLGLRELAGGGRARVIAEVKAANVASRRVFETLGFRRAAAEAAELLRYTCTISPR